MRNCVFSKISAVGPMLVIRRERAGISRLVKSNHHLTPSLWPNQSHIGGYSELAARVEDSPLRLLAPILIPVVEPHTFNSGDAYSLDPRQTSALEGTLFFNLPKSLPPAFNHPVASLSNIHPAVPKLTRERRGGRSRRAASTAQRRPLVESWTECHEQ